MNNTWTRAAPARGRSFIVKNGNNTPGNYTCADFGGRSPDGEMIQIAGSECGNRVQHTFGTA